MKLIVGVTLFFVANILAFAVAVHAGVPFVGVAFYVWVGFFSLSIIAQFWSYANDIYTKDAGNRLFPIIGIGATAGSPVGAWVAGRLFDAHVSPHLMLYLAAGLLLLTLVLYVTVNRGASRPAPARRGLPRRRRRSGSANAFSLVFGNRYILLIAVLLIVLNVVNTVGEYILSHLVVEHASALAAADPSFDKNAYIGAYYGSYFFWVNVIAVLLQAFVASRLVKRFGLAGVLYALPLIALGAYGFVAVGATIAIVRAAKTAENATDYSVMNTAKQLLWLPTTPRGEVQGQAGRGQLLRPARRPRRRLRGLRGHRVGDAGRERLRDREPVLHRPVARPRGGARAAEPAARRSETKA